MPQLPTICKTTAQQFVEVIAWYNCDHKRLDLEFWPAEDNQLPCLRITYEGGYPYEEYGEKPQSVSRGQRW